uniref:Uncharacterized protein n=2 Tax=Oryza sativa subsp. japonica TaxID=39947 RepID=Q69Q45_ORYSJ|nr:hypothetical protein [Oryza sativa Japonica Group]
MWRIRLRRRWIWPYRGQIRRGVPLLAGGGVGGGDRDRWWEGRRIRPLWRRIQSPWMAAAGGRRWPTPRRFVAEGSGDGDRRSREGGDSSRRRRVGGGSSWSAGPATACMARRARDPVVLEAGWEMVAGHGGCAGGGVGAGGGAEWWRRWSLVVMAAAEPKLRWAANAARQLGVCLPPGKMRSPPPDLGREHHASVDVLVPHRFGRRVHCGGWVNSTVRRVAWRRRSGLVVRGDTDNGFVAEPAVTLSGGATVLSTFTFLDICPLATATLSAKVGHVGQASVGERASILLSHPLPIQPNCVDGAGVCRGSSFPMAIDWRRGAGAVAVRRRFSLVVAAERVGVQFLGETNFGRKLCLRAGNNDACDSGTFGVVPFSKVSSRRPSVSLVQWVLL